ncbi:MAG TPA: trypsin-like peptidase domain-containing protein [Kofleriaceae bacterium]|nr:trypsin-like peptidase domain-containing protein [Kofleriaceae bacterium]
MKTVFAIACTSLLIGCMDPAEDADDLGLGETEQHTICGATDDSQFVNDYNGTLGPTTTFVQTHKKNKAALASSATSTSSGKYCSGSLIATDLFLTAGHCVDSTTIGDYVSLNYERAAGSTTLLTQSHYQVTAIVEDDVGGVDYAIVRVSGSPGATWGVSAVAAGDPATGAAITIIGHPNAAAKKIEAGTVASYSGNYMRYGNVDTLGGSSGSGVLDSSGQIVGVHTNGGCTATGGTNSGIRISRIRAVSSVL